MEKRVYYIDFDDTDFESGINLIAITQNPAIEISAMRFSAQDLLDFKFTYDDEKRIIAGPAIVPNKEILRLDDAGNEYFVVFTAEVIERMANKFNKEQRTVKFNLEHSKYTIDAFVKASWIVEDSEKDKSAYYGYTLPVGTFFVEAKIESDKDWELIKKMDNVGYSIEGFMGIVPKPKEEEFNKTKQNKMKKRKFAASFFKSAKTVKRYNTKLKKFETVAATPEDEVVLVNDLTVGEEVTVVNDEQQVVPAADGEYEIPSEEISIVVTDGKIEDILPMESEEEMSEKEMIDEEEEDKKEMSEKEIVDEEEEDKIKLVEGCDVVEEKPKPEPKKEEDNIVEKDVTDIANRTTKTIDAMGELISKIADLQTRIDKLEIKMPKDEVEEVIEQEFSSVANKIKALKKMLENGDN